jgi:putative spermidine/putrescine transport system permease protein
MTEQSRHLGLRIFCVLVGILLVAPTLVVIPMAFTSAESFQFPPPGFSTRWFHEFFSDPNWMDAAVLSLKVAIVVSLLATALGTLASFALVRGRGPWRAPAQGFLLAPMIVPGVIVAIGIYAVFLKWKLTATFQGFVLAHLVLAIPLVIVPVSASLQTLDRRLEQAAASLGATPFATFRQVTLPLILPAMLTGALFAFLTSFDEAIVSLFISGPFDRTLPVQLYQSVTSSLTPTIAAASTLVIALSTSLRFIAAIIASRRRIKNV